MSLSFCVRFSADAEQLVEKAALLRQAACGQGLWLHSPRTAAFGDRFALHMPRHWPCGGVCALRAALSARLPAREASHRSDTRLRAQSPPLFGGIRRVACTLPRKDARLRHRQLFPGRFFYFFAFFNSLFRRCGFQLAFSLHLKFLNTTRFDFSIGSLPPFTSSFYSNSHHFVSRATTRIRPLSLWLSQVLNVKSCSPHCAPAPPQ